VPRPLLLALAALAVSCRLVSLEGGDPTGAAAVRQEVAAAMQRYQAAARTVNPDSIAAFYTATATLFEPGIDPIRTRDSIRAFIASFPGVRVDVATATPDTIEVFGATAFLWGSYLERLAFPGQAVSEQRGKFVAQWVRQPDGVWLMQRLFRIPVATVTAPSR
jgi:ketosteroid isomerase-like protein